MRDIHVSVEFWHSTGSTRKANYLLAQPGGMIRDGGRLHLHVEMEILIIENAKLDKITTGCGRPAP